MATKALRPTVLCILDGWGYNPNQYYNAVLQAKTPNFDRLWGEQAQREKTAFLQASERAVGLPDGQIGNSEVGHTNIGAGRVVYQDILKISKAIEEGTLKEAPALKRHIEALKKSKGTCHVMGLVSPGGVHALDEHISAVAKEISSHGIPTIVHAFTDGRDVPPQDAINTLPKFIDSLKGSKVTIGTVIGRYYSMDRDHRWERVAKAYRAMVSAEGVAKNAASPIDAVRQAYDAKQTDEFIEPTVVNDFKGMKDGDGIFVANFRSDRAREILCALADPDPPEGVKKEIDVTKRPKFADICGMVQYSERHEEYMGEPVFPVKDIQNVLGEIVAKAGLTQLRIAETEKYPHVTFFFNGGREEPFENEERILVPSPKVATYDLKPEMSAPEVGEKLCNAVDSGKFDMVICNFANPDMVGHTGSLPAAIKAVETVDTCLGNLLESVKRQRGAVIVTADHGNCETMWNPETNGPHTAHTLSKVPVIFADYSEKADDDLQLNDGALCDIAPTMLTLLGVEQPKEMTGKSLLTKRT